MTHQHFSLEEILTAASSAGRDKFNYAKSHPFTREAVEHIENTTGIKFPADFLSFAQQYNGLCVLAKDELWPEPENFDIRYAWEFQSGLVILGIDAHDLPEWASIMRAYRLLAERYDITNVLPLLKIYGDNSIFWGVRDDGAFVEVAFGEVTCCDNTFTQVYAEQIEALIHRLDEWMAKNKSTGSSSAG